MLLKYSIHDSNMGKMSVPLVPSLFLPMKAFLPGCYPLTDLTWSETRKVWEVGLASLRPVNILTLWTPSKIRSETFEKFSSMTEKNKIHQTRETTVIGICRDVLELSDVRTESLCLHYQIT